MNIAQSKRLSIVRGQRAASHVLRNYNFIVSKSPRRARPQRDVANNQARAYKTKTHPNYEK